MKLLDERVLLAIYQHYQSYLPDEEILEDNPDAPTQRLSSLPPRIRKSLQRALREYLQHFFKVLLCVRQEWIQSRSKQPYAEGFTKGLKVSQNIMKHALELHHQLYSLKKPQDPQNEPQGDVMQRSNEELEDVEEESDGVVEESGQSDHSQTFAESE